MKYIIVSTEIKGKSVFAKTSILKDELIGEYYRNYANHIYKKNIFGFFDRDLGRYCNHSFNPNTYVKETTDDTGYDLYAINDIELGEEILVNYTLMEQLSNVPPNTFYKSNFNEIKQTFIIKNLI
jgi:SET domain-containing protein